MSEINRHRPAHGTCIHSILYLWAVATYLAVASNVLGGYEQYSVVLGSHEPRANDGRSSSHGEPT